MTAVEHGVAGMIHARLAECSPAERRVARVLLAAYPTAALETVAVLAERAGVSGPTVLRFVNRLGFRGYPEFQKALRDELSERDTSPLAAFTAEPPAAPGGALERARRVLPAAVEATLAELPEAEVEAAVKLLADPHLRVTAHGGRFSGLLAHYLVMHLIQVRGNARLLPAGQVERAGALAELGRRDLLVLFDYRRYEQPTLTIAQAAREHDCKIILLTDRWLSPIAGVADVVLPSRVDSPSAYDSFVPTVAVLETLIDGMIARLGAAAGERLSSIETAAQRYGLLD
ncbi:RpiR family transcriptional regulator [Catellatospora sp. TT07R-123]|uniref:MurR/RpiR family transcriptional regulator n=1 Tax=Catellatospora sp. TT07R-123 TaxID=2733863 RepID=UPI001B2510C0|nr:MurR/RpiR family transcriptional regulator [Catellatospora sp. TT07R-123]GHJ43696.1 RpiR family transcriptional regulator [Catellatospora sp. TT07R-123]